MRSQVLTRVLTLKKYIFGLFFFLSSYTFAQQPFNFRAPGGKWVPSSNPTTIPHRWEGNSGTYPWTLTPRTGLKDETFPFYPNPDYLDFNNTTNIPGFARGIYIPLSDRPISVLIDEDTVVRAKNSDYYISERVQGYMEYLPKDYNAPGNTQTYPLIIYFPGCGELGNGVFYTHPPFGTRPIMPNYMRGLGRIMKPSGSNDLFNSLPRELLFNGDYFSNIPLKTPGQVYPASGGPTQGVIVMACIVSGNQIDGNIPNRSNDDVCLKYMTPTNNDVENAINTALHNYRVDVSRIYVTGMSAGGGIAYAAPSEVPSLARKIAAIVPVAAVETVWGNRLNIPAEGIHYAENIVNNGVSVLAITNLYDTRFWVIDNNQQSISWLQSVPGVKPGQIASKFFTFPSGDIVPQGNPMHDAWQYAYRSRSSPSYTTSSSTFISTPYTDSRRKEAEIWVDPVSGEKYTTYEWLLTKQNLLLLPAQITAFTASRVNQGVQVSWTTAQEINTSHFVLERSTDGVKFQKLIEKPSAGNSNVKRDYGHLDAQLPTTQYVYYRLTQVDRDGKSTITGVRKVYIGHSGFEVSIYPNVATSNVNLDIQGLVNEALTVQVIDVAGRPLMQQVIAPRQNRVNLDVSKLSKGMYMVQVTGTAKNVVVKFIKQ